MEKLSPETVWRMTNKELARTLNKDLFLKRRKKIHFYAPSFMYYRTRYFRSSPEAFPTVSLTGKGCALKCKHCEGKVLETMHSATTPQKLYRLCSQLKLQGAQGCLMSGGCLPDGSVPLGPFAETIGRVKRELGLTVLVHTGMIDLQTAKALKRSGVDTALMDVIGSDDTIKEIYRLNMKVEDYADSLKALQDAKLAFVPHVIVGLHYGKLKGEREALEMIADYEPSALVIIAFMPIHGTEMEKIEPPTPLSIGRVILTARVAFPQTPLVLGCMRPKGEHRTKTDVLAIKAGVDAVAFPAEEAVEFARNQGVETVFSSFCCSQIYADLAKSADSEH